MKDLKTRLARKKMAANFIRKMEFLMKEHVELRLFKKIKNPKGYLDKGI